MSYSFRRTSWVLAAAVASALLTAACDDDDNSTPTSASSPAPVQAASPSPTATPSPEPSPGNFDVGSRVAIFGQARQIDISGQMLRVRGNRVCVNSDTAFRNLGGGTIVFSDVRQGEFVRVRGIVQPDQCVLAESITVQR